MTRQRIVRKNVYSWSLMWEGGRAEHGLHTENNMIEKEE
jgi:hypothetical protein